MIKRSFNSDTDMVVLDVSGSDSQCPTMIKKNSFFQQKTGDMFLVVFVTVSMSAYVGAPAAAHTSSSFTLPDFTWRTVPR